MGKFFLFSLSIIYLFAEFIFNFNLTYLVSNSTIQNFKDIEVFGRSISAIGACLLFFRFVFNKKYSLLKTFLISLIFLPLIFVGTYKAQERFLSFINKETPQSIKIEQSQVYLLQKGLSTNTIYLDDRQLAHDSNNRSAFIISVGLLGFDNFLEPYYSILENKKDLIFYNDFKKNMSYYYKGYLSFHDIPDLAYSNYDVFNRNINSKIREETSPSKLSSYWITVKSNEHRIYKGYPFIKKSYHNDLKNEINYFVSKLTKDFKNKLSCNVKGCNDNWNNIIVDYQNSFKYGYKPIDPDFVCKKSTKNSLKFISHLNGTQYIKLPKKTVNGSFSCVVDTRHLEIKIKKYYKKLYFKKYNITNLNIDIKNKYAMNVMTKEIINKMIKKDYGVVLTSNWSLSDKHSFEHNLKNSITKKILDESMLELKKEQGFYIPLNLNEKSFFKNKNVQNKLKSSLGIYYSNNFISNLSFVSFISKYEDSFKYNIGNSFQKNIDTNNYFIDNIFKATIVPIIAILFSLVFGLLNFTFLMRDIILSLFKINSKKSTFFVSSLFISIVIIVPFFINNSYIYSNVFNDIFLNLKEYNVFLAYSYKWFLNTETIILNLFNHHIFLIPFNYNGEFGSF